MTENEAKEFLTNFTLDRISYANGKEVDVERFDYFTDVLKTSIVALEEIQKYRTIGTVIECREAVRKQRVKKPIDGSMRKVLGYYQCPSCGGLLTTKEHFCGSCGQAILWEHDTE